MKIIAFNASPKGIRGNTQKILSLLMNGAKDAGAETELVLLKNKKIKPCIGCLNCWFTTPGRCAISDDISLLREKLLSADYIIMATPIYLFSISSHLKLFVERLLFPLSKPEIELINNRSCHSSTIIGKKLNFILLTTGAFDDEEDIQDINKNFSRIIHSTVYPNKDNIATLHGYINIRPILLLADPSIAAKCAPLFEYIGLIGHRIVTTGAVDIDLLNKINQPIYHYAELDRIKAMQRSNKILCEMQTAKTDR